jgi:hypothetical protein
MQAFKNNVKIVFALYILSIIAPFLTTILLVRTRACFTLLFVDLISLLALISMTIVLTKKLKEYVYKVSVTLGALLALTVFFFGYGYILHAGDFVYFKTHEAQFTELMEDINQSEAMQRKINPNHLDSLENQNKKRLVYSPYVAYSIEEYTPDIPEEEQKRFINKLKKYEINFCHIYPNKTIIFNVLGSAIDDGIDFIYSPTGVKPAWVEEWHPVWTNCMHLMIKSRSYTGS